MMRSLRTRGALTAAILLAYLLMLVGSAAILGMALALAVL